MGTMAEKALFLGLSNCDTLIDRTQSMVLLPDQTKTGRYHWGDTVQKVAQLQAMKGFTGNSTSDCIQKHSGSQCSLQSRGITYEE